MPSEVLPVGDGQKEQRLNFIYNIMDGALYAFAMSLVSTVTVLPVLVKKIGGSNVAVGLIPVIWIIGFNFPQVLIAAYTSRQDSKKRLVLKTALIQRIPWLLLAIVTATLVGKVSPHWALVLIFGGLSLAAIGGSLNLPGWFDLVAKITPVGRRGSLFAYRSILGALLGVAGGAAVSHVLDTVVFPVNYAILFSMAFLIMMVSYIFLILLKEPLSTETPPGFKGDAYFKKLREIIRQESGYRQFLIADALLVTALMGDAFYAVNALQKFSLSEGFTGRFIVVMMVSMIFGNLIFGKMADRSGHKRNLQIAASSTAVISVIAIVAPLVEVYYLVFAGSALTMSMLHISRLPFIAEICVEENRPIYIALTNMITAPFILMGLFGGWIADNFGYPPVFMISGLFATASLVWWWQKVPEPRKRKINVNN